MPYLKAFPERLEMKEILLHPLTNLDEPVFVYHPEKLKDSVSYFLEHFPGVVGYSVKANCTPEVLRDLRRAGISLFDAASVPEMELVQSALGSDCQLSFSNACRKTPHVSSAYKMGVRHFAVDSHCEVDKLTAHLPNSQDIIVPVRIKAPFYENLFDQPHKFGASRELAMDLLKRVHACGFTPALTFHVGAFSLNPISYAAALALCKELILAARALAIEVKYINMGGGFPVDGIVDDAPRLIEFFNVISSFRRIIPSEVEFLCEPGRALVASSQSLVTTVLGIKHDEKSIFISDGGEHGNLREYHHATRKVNIPFGVVQKQSSIVRGVDPKNPLYEIYGFSCDADIVPFKIPVASDLAVGDRLIFPQMGAYSSVQNTRFNGNGLFNTMFVEKGRSVQCW